MKKHIIFFMSIMLISGAIFAQSLTSAKGVRVISQNGGDKSLTGGITCTSPSYVPGTTQTLNFELQFASPDAEFVDGVSMTFPAGMVPQTAGTSNPLATANGCGPTMDMTPISGQTVVWGQITTPSSCGALTQGTYAFSVSVTIGAGVTGTQSIGYYVMGDGYGGTPHSLTGTINIAEATASDVGTQSITMGSFYQTGTIVTPTAVVQNYGTTTETFDVSIVINDGSVDVYTDNTTVTNLAPAATQNLSFNNWTAVLGNYTVTVTTLLAGDANAANNTITQPFAVGDLPEALTGNTTDGLYHSINLATGALTNLGTINSSPFPMAEEYNGTSIYRVYSDASFGTVAPDGSFSSLGSLTGVAGTPTGLAWNWTTSTMYVVVLDAGNLPHLCTLDLGTLALTEIGVGTGMLIAMDFANDGLLYAPSLDDDNLYSINPATGATTIIGPVGIDLNFGQDVSFDHVTNTLYTITCGTAYQFGTYNLATGAFTMISDAAAKQHATFVITNPGIVVDKHDIGVTALVAPTSGELTNAETVTVTITNFGTFAETGFDVALQIDGGTVETQTVSATVNPGATIDYTFTGTFDFSATGAINVVSWTELATDEDNTNDTLDVSINNTTSIFEASNTTFEVYPNPAKDYVQIVAENIITKIEVYNMNGQLVFKSLVGAKQYHLNAESFANGMYSIKVYNENGVSAQQIMISK